MMDAIHIELSQDHLEVVTNRSPVTGDLCLWGRDLWVDRDKFFQVVRGGRVSISQRVCTGQLGQISIVCEGPR